MLRRCELESDSCFPKYGAKGIKVCERWHIFENFIADMGEPPSGHSIEREDNNGNYEPNNCKWATLLEQANNTSANRFHEFNGRRMTTAQWARETGIAAGTIERRLERGWPIERALSTPRLQTWSRRGAR
jgi:hypothetical protein